MRNQYGEITEAEKQEAEKELGSESYNPGHDSELERRLRENSYVETEVIRPASTERRLRGQISNLESEAVLKEGIAKLLSDNGVEVLDGKHYTHSQATLHLLKGRKVLVSEGHAVAAGVAAGAVAGVGAAAVAGAVAGAGAIKFQHVGHEKFVEVIRYDR